MQSQLPSLNCSDEPVQSYYDHKEPIMEKVVVAEQLYINMAPVKVFHPNSPGMMKLEHLYLYVPLYSRWVYASATDMTITTVTLYPGKAKCKEPFTQQYFSLMHYPLKILLPW